MHDYDVIIIGAGIGGLTCGALLAKHGMSVLICEQHDKPGGYCTSYKRGGYRFDVPHVMSGMREGAPVQRVLSHIGADRLVEFAELDRALRLVYPDVTVDVYTDLARYEEELVRHFPKHRAAIGDLLRAQAGIWNKVVDARSASDEEDSLMSGLPRMSYDSFVSRFIKDPDLRELLESVWVYVGVDPAAVSAVAMIMMYMSFHASGAWYPKCGFQALSDAVAERLKEFGAELRLREKVGGVVFDARRARGIRLEGGEVITSRRVVSNADTKVTFLKLVRKGLLPVGQTEVLEHSRLSMTGCIVNMVVKNALPVELMAGEVLFYPRYNHQIRSFQAGQERLSAKVSRETAFGLAIRSAEPIAQDSSILKIDFAPLSYGYFEILRDENHRDYAAAKERIGRELLQAVEHLVPGVSKRTVVQDVVTPLTFKRYTGASEGCFADLALTPQQLVFMRRIARTPVEGLYMTGVKNPFFLVPGILGAIMGGYDTADVILGRKLSKEGILWK